ncbi:hypothetical protein MERGE_002998 [Pneumocystis wakefieldiae]|uniref:Uncharacterized protein n=1 Tax=Pneumocystis wakefieldiae TaxID=38082 RepID=A0A899FZF3_9ASCO|nr:hypothetical protein MERGE_002998 [Pneumocystis wakefieldiae]
MEDIYEYILDENKWVYLLENHPIFSLSEKEEERIRSLEDMKSLIAVRQTEVFVGVDNTIRYADLKECKIEDQKNRRMDYKEFKLRKITFHIERLIINICGSILVVAGSHDLAIIFLPTYLNSLEESSLSWSKIL